MERVIAEHGQLANQIDTHLEEVWYGNWPTRENLAEFNPFRLPIKRPDFI